VSESYSRIRAVHSEPRPRTRSVSLSLNRCVYIYDGRLQQRRRREHTAANNAACPMRRKRTATNYVVCSNAGHGGRKASYVRAVMSVSDRYIHGCLQTTTTTRHTAANNAACPMRRKRTATNNVVRSNAGHGGRKASCACRDGASIRSPGRAIRRARTDTGRNCVCSSDNVNRPSPTRENTPGATS